MLTILMGHGEYVLSAIALSLLFSPIIHYLITGWTLRRREIMGSISDDMIRKYFGLFFFEEFADSTNLRHDFEKLYHKRSLRRYFILPGACLLAISGFLIVVVSTAIFEWLRKEATLESLGAREVAVAAVTGAYVWVVFDFVRRARRGDLGAMDLYAAALSFIIAAPLGFAVATLFAPQLGVAIALALGAFPTPALFTLARRYVTSKLNLGTAPSEQGYELQQLQGIGRSEAERFEDEGVTNILQLAYSDPISLTIGTGFSFSYVVDCCSQALARLYFEQDLVKMRRFGLRGSQEISTLIYEMDDPKQSSTRSPKSVAEQAGKCLQEVAKALKMDRVVLERSMRETAEDPYTEFLCEVWLAS